MTKERILITVKTYPTPSKSYEELVCTAGLREDGSWIRLYPIPFRKMPYSQQYKKYDWIEVAIKRNTKDFRRESHYPISDISIVGNVSTANKWQERRKLVLERAKVYTNLSELIQDSKSPKFTSLAVFKPTEVLDFTYEPADEEEWDENIIKRLSQGNLLEPSTFQPVKKLPFVFRYKFNDDKGKQSTLMIEDWELGVLYWRYANQSKKIACQKVKEKYFTEFLTKTDLHFFLGTTKQYHNTSKNPFIIIGAFYPPKVQQPSLF